MKNKIVTVFGATGAQGGGLVRAILADKDSAYQARAITRNAESDKAKELADQGAEVVEADLDSVGSIKKALDGAEAAFLVTNFWEHFSPEKEIEQVKNFIEAAKESDLKHIVWSTLEDTRKWIPLDDDRMPTLQEKYKVPHFDSKGSADILFEQAGLPVTYLLTSFYWDNFIHFGMGPQKAEDGNYYFAFPMDDKKLSGIAAEDIGKSAYGIIKRGNELVGKTIGIAGESLTGDEMATKLSSALGKKVIYNAVTPETYRGFGFPGADDLGNMFQFKRDFNNYFVGIRDPSYTQELNPALQSFDDWLEANASRIPIE